MPCLDEEAYIEASVRSVLAQDYPADRMEILVADGGSTDHTLTILERLATSDSRIRVLPNPHYVRELRPLTGRDAKVDAYLVAQPEVLEMLAQVEAFLRRWLPAFEADQRSYLTVAIGCTGGQHRSVWFAERLAAAFAASGTTLVRHRELDAAG